MSGALERRLCWLRAPPRGPESAQILLFPHPSPWPEQPCGQLAAAAQPPAPGCQGWQPHGHAAQLCASPPQFIPSRYTVAALYLDHFSVLWYFGGFSNPSLLPLPFPVAGFLRRGVLGESCKHICSLAAAFQEGPVRGSGPREPGHAGQWRLEGRVQGPWQLGLVVGTLSAAGRAEPQGRGWCQSPGATAHQLLALLAVAAGSQLRSVYARLGVREKRGAFRNTLAFRLLFCQRS